METNLTRDKYGLAEILINFILVIGKYSSQYTCYSTINKPLKQLFNNSKYYNQS